MFCYHCGSTLEPGTQFCPRCGAAVQAGPAQPAGQAPQGSVCARCGARLEPGSRFCDQCGATTAGGAGPTQPPPAGNQRKTPPTSRGRRSGGLGKKVAALIAVGAVLAVAALAMVAVPMVIQLTNPRAYLTACAANTLARLSSASEAAADSLGVGAVLDSAADRPTEQEFTITLGELPVSLADYSTRQILSGAGLSLLSQSDLDNRQMAVSYTLMLGGMDLGSVTLAMEDDLIALGSPEITNGVFYGFRTETMGADFNANPALQGSVPPDTSFNVFDLIERWQQEKLVLTDETLARMAQLNGQLADGMVVERDGDTVTAILSPAAARTWARGMYDAVVADENLRSYLGLAMEGSGATLDEMLAPFSQQIDQVLDYLQEDVHITCTIQDNYISRTVAETTVDGVAITLDVSLGTGAHHMDGFALNLDMEQVEGGQSMTLRWTSRGDHSAQGGVYTDESQVEVAYNGASAGKVAWSTRWEPEGTGDNFAWTLSAWDGSDAQAVLDIAANGSVTVDRRAGSLRADLYDVSLTAEGETLSLSLLYALTPCDTLSLLPDAGQVLLLPDMSQSELEEALWQVQANAIDLIYNLELQGW